MFGRRINTTILAAACIVLFAVGLAWLFWMRFQSGDLYPPYSSLRGDPLGTQVLYESLRRIDARGARRNFRPLDQVQAADGETLAVIGLSDANGFLDALMWRPLLDRIARDGGRLLVAFSPSGRAVDPEPTRCNHADDASAPDGQAGIAADDHERPAWPGVMAKLGVTLRSTDPDEEAFADTARRVGAAPGRLPGQIPWRAPFYFDLRDPEWQSCYTWEDRPVIIVRPWGRGSVVMSTDSYLFSNEAMRGDRQAALLAWLVPSGRVIVDELHHGLRKRPGIAGLMRKYRLQGVAACLMILAMLTIWRHTAVFMSRPPDRSDNTRGKEIGPSTDGWIDLMRQHIPPRDLLRTSYQAWRTSAAAARLSEDRLALVAELVEASASEPRRHPPATVYRRICELLGKGIVHAPRHRTAETDPGRSQTRDRQSDHRAGAGGR